MLVEGHLLSAASEFTASVASDASEKLLVGLAVAHDALEVVPGGRLVLLGGLHPAPVGGVQHDIANVIAGALLGGEGGLQGLRNLEVSDGLGLERQVAEGGDVALVGACGNLGDLLLDGLRAELSGVAVLHPGDGEEIAQAAAHVLALHDVVGRAVEAPGRLLGVGGGDSEDLAVLGEVGEHGARLARLHVEGQFLEHFLGLHRLKSLGQVRGVHVRPVWEGDDADAAVVDEVEEDPVVLSALQDLAGATFGQVAVVAGDHL
mmetsp:Transcript_14449/g.21893  ORF Transcript_14449/g.21893 Transcript_14449/m.21893 type:complete len:262 (+) Transcript_14449:308-1093(+)